MIGLGKYPGDERTKELLTKYAPNISFDELKAATTGSILAVEMVQPSQLFAHLLKGEEPQFERKEDATEWFSCLMGLWNELTAHQKPGNPFLFSEWPTEFKGTKAELLQKATSREKEIEQFIWGLKAGHTPFIEVLTDQDRNALLSWLPVILEAGLRIMKKARTDTETGSFDEAAKLSACHLAINQQIEEVHAKFIDKSLKLRRQWMKEMNASRSQPENSAPRTGRNETCPCGSGKKYKHCCLH